MDRFAPSLKKARSDIYSNVNGSYKGFGGGSIGDFESARFTSPEGRYRPLDGTTASEKELLTAGLGSKSKACLKFFSTSGCPYGEGCHFSHYVPGGVSALDLTQVSKTGSSLGGLKRGPPGTSLEQASAAGGYKSRMCKNFNTPEGCRFGDKCHFAHGEGEIKSDRDTKQFASSLAHGPDSRLDGVKGNQEQTSGLAAAASFGASSTAKISIDASLAGAIIGKGGINAKSICRLTGAKLSIRDHESDTNLRNIEMEGTFDQIKQASAMVRELLMQKDIIPPKPTGFGSHNYKTKACEKFAEGHCTFGERCHFAHGASELRQPAA
eukprot:c26970_g1_i2 orf=322-1293(+)